MSHPPPSAALAVFSSRALDDSLKPGAPRSRSRNDISHDPRILLRLYVRTPMAFQPRPLALLIAFLRLQFISRLLSEARNSEKPCCSSNRNPPTRSAKLKILICGSINRCTLNGIFRSAAYSLRGKPTSRFDNPRVTRV